MGWGADRSESGSPRKGELVTMDRRLTPAKTAHRHCRPGLGLQMGGVGPEAQPPGVPGRAERKERPGP